MKPPIVAGQPYTDRLRDQLKRECQTWNVPMPTDSQVGAVLHAMADHTAIMTMLEHRPDPTSPWPQATSVGRFLHDAGDGFESRDWKPGDSK